MNIQKLYKAGIITLILMSIGLACAAPGIALPGGGAVEPVQQTANALSTSVVATQTAMVAALPSVLPPTVAVPEVTQELSPTPEIPVAVETVDANLPTVEPPAPPAAEVAHKNTPGEPGTAKNELKDALSSETANLKHAPSGSDNYNLGLFERPFTANDMVYRPDLDIEKAEIFTDGMFFYVTIYLNNLGAPSPTAVYTVELDTDKDGRGDFLIWSGMPASNQWSINGMKVFSDVNNDVGGKTVMRSDAPSSGNGYENVVFDAVEAASMRDPDSAWSRLSPANPKGIQIAFKQDLLDNKKSFLWSVFADDGLKDPARYDYNDVFKLEEAGSPLEKNDYYPVKAVSLVDNTCRMVYGYVATGSEPGLCGGVETTVKVPTVVPPTNVPIPSIPTKLPF